LSTAIVLALMGAATAKSSHHQQEQMPVNYSAVAPSLKSGRQIEPGYETAQPSPAVSNGMDETGYRSGPENPYL
jgi:hypothetical protein